MPADAIPVLDLSLGETDAVVDQLRRACGEVGFFYVGNHGVPEELVRGVFGAARDVFALPAAAKAGLADGAGFGYTSKQITLDPATQSCPDTREQWKIARAGYDEDYSAAAAETGAPPPPAQRGVEEAAAVWPPVAGAFRETVTAYFAAMDALSRRLVRLLALALGLPAAYFDAPGLFDRPMSLLLFNHYFAEQSNPDHGIFGCGAHTDYGMLTVLACDGVRGLQICRNKAAAPHEQEWADVPPRPGHFIINLGDILEFWSGGRFRSTLHRVVLDGTERFSIPFFFEPNARCPAAALPGSDAAAAGFTYGAWLRRRFEETGEVAPTYRAPAVQAPA